MAELSDLMAEHRSMPFPASVVKGIDYGSVDPVMIGADIFGWARRRANGELSQRDRDRLLAARDDLKSSLDAFPADARAYYVKLLELANAALA